MLAEICEGLAKALNVVFAFLASDDNIVNVRRGVSIQLGAQDCFDGSIEGIAHSWRSISMIFAANALPDFMKLGT